MKHRLRPQRSVNLLQGIIRTAMITKNSVIVVCTPVTVVSRSWLMSLIITFMFEPAKLQMNWARASGARSRREATRRPYCGWEPVSTPPDTRGRTLAAGDGNREGRLDGIPARSDGG